MRITIALVLVIGLLLACSAPKTKEEQDAVNENQEVVKKQRAEAKKIRLIEEEKVRVEIAEKAKTHGDSQLRVEAWVITQGLVEKLLLSPSTASFGWFEQTSESNVRFLGGGQYRCFGWVDSKNGFNATIRSQFDVTLEHDGKGWRAVR